MGLIRWIFSIGVLAIWLALIGTGLYVAMYQAPETPEGQAIVVLAHGMDEAGTSLSPESESRLAKGIELYGAGKAPLLVLTGGGTPPVARAMEEVALAAGVPADAIIVEDASLSTLQNALFTADIERVAHDRPILLVTHRYHLPRANASFRWAGFEDVRNVAADPDEGFAITEGLLWEAVKWPYNALRAAAASASEAANVPRESYITYLE